MMMTISGNVSSSSDGSRSYPEDPSSSTTWKLIYHNPFFYNKPIHRRLFSSGEMEREEKKGTVVEAMQAEIEELKAALHHQRRSRRKSEHFNSRLVEELNKERRRSEVLERVCEDLSQEMSRDRAITAKMKLDMEEERRMLRMAEVLREERVHMKLTEAQIFLEEKMSSLLQKKQVSSEKKNSVFLVTRRRAVAAAESEARAPLPENPHIRRGMEGFVEFPRVVRAFEAKMSRHKVESQIKILMKQRSSGHLI